MVTLYDNKTKQLMEEKIDGIINEAKEVEMKNLNPSPGDYNNILNIIFFHLKNKKCIIYGKNAIHSLIKFKNKDDGYYLELKKCSIFLNPDNYNFPIVEAYSISPYEDIKELSHILYDKKYNFIEVTNNSSSSNFTISVDGTKYLTLSYLPENLSFKINTIKVNEIMYLDPNLIIADSLQIYTSLLINSNIIKDTIKVTNKFLQYYSLNLKNMKKMNTTKINKETNKILNIIRKNVLKDNVVFGYYAYYYYKYQGSNKKLDNLYIPYYDILTLNFKKTIEKIKKNMPNLTVKFFNPLFKYFSKKASFYFNNQLVLNVYDQQGQCIQYNYLKKKNIYICSYQYLIFSSIIKSIFSNDINFNFIIKDIVEIRNKFLKNKTLLDNTPFQEFNSKCKGKTITEARKIRLEWIEKKKKKIPKILRYKPSDPKDLDIKLANISGNEIL